MHVRSHKMYKNISIQDDMTAGHHFSVQETFEASNARCELLQKDVTVKLEKLIKLVATVFSNATGKLPESAGGCV